MSEIKLLRCPFCGGEAELLKGQCEIDNYVMCLECRSKTKLYNTKASAIKAWNTRKPMQNIVERLEQRTEYFKDCTKYGNETEEQEERSYSTMMMYEVADLVDDLIEIVKEEGGLNE